MGAPAHVDFMIVGTPRSGTTLVQRLACELDGVSVPPETHFFRSLVPALLRRRQLPLDERGIVEELREFAALETSRGLQLDAQAVLARLGPGGATAAELFTAIVHVLAGEAQLYGEKTPSHLRWWPLLVEWFPHLRLIVVVRDPRAVVSSYFSAWGQRPHAVLAERWALDQDETALIERSVDPARCLVLRYEDVVGAPGAARARLAAFLGTCDAGEPLPVPLRLPWETWKENAYGPVRPERADAWRTALPPGLLAEIEYIAAEGMARYGYPPVTRWAGPQAREPGDRDARACYRSERARERDEIAALAASTPAPSCA